MENKIATVVWNEYIAQTANNGINFSFTDLKKRIKETIDEALSQPPVSRWPFSQHKIKMEDKIKALKANLEQTKAKLHVAVKALEDVKKWDDDLEDEWGDPGERASRALEKIAMLDGF